MRHWFRRQLRLQSGVQHGEPSCLYSLRCVIQELAGRFDLSEQSAKMCLQAGLRLVSTLVQEKRPGLVFCRTDAMQWAGAGSLCVFLALFHLQGVHAVLMLLPMLSPMAPYMSFTLCRCVQ